jgi:hypothetical protein
LNRSIAAAKLANVTKRNNPPSSPDMTPNNNTRFKYHHHRHHHHHKKTPFKSSILHPTGSSLKSCTSNGSGAENFSTDDAEEITNSRTPPSPNYDQPITNANKIPSTSK